MDVVATKVLAFSTRCCRTKSDKKGNDNANNGFVMDFHLVNDGEAYELGDVNW